MSQTYFPGRPFVQEWMPDDGQHRRQIARGLNLVMQGHTNNTMQVTLAASAGTTTVMDARLSLSTSVTATPMTADAAAEIASGNMYFTPATGELVITHTNAASTDRTFNLAIHG